MIHFSNLLPPNRKNIKKDDWKRINTAHPHLKNLHASLPQEFSAIPIKEKLESGQTLSDYFQQEGYFVFAFVRHPFDRLVSAYKDKIEGEGSEDETFQRLKFKLKDKYGSNDFQSFLKNVRETLRNHEKCIKGAYVVNSENCYVDEHWRPYYQTCAYCDMTYNFIGRLENYGADMLEVVKRANLTSIISTEEASELHIQFTSHDSSQRGQSTGLDLSLPIKASSRAYQYFAKVDKSLIKELLKLYARDFQLFQYSPEGF